MTRKSLGGAVLLAVVMNAASCSHVSPPSAACLDACVGPVPFAELARLIPETDLWENPRPPFVIVSHPLLVSPAAIRCQWGPDWLNYSVENPGAQPYFSLSPMDKRRRENVGAFDAALRSQVASAEVSGRSDLPSYDTAFLCSQGELVALLVDHGMAGGVLIVKEVNGRWELVRAMLSWIA